MSDKLKTLLKQVTDAASEIIAAIQKTDAKIVELQKQRQQIGDAPVTRAEWLEYIGAEIDRKAGSFGAGMRRMVSSIDASFFALERLGRLPGDLLAGNRSEGLPGGLTGVPPAGGPAIARAPRAPLQPRAPLSAFSR